MSLSFSNSLREVQVRTLKEPEYENEVNLCPYCSEKMIQVTPCEYMGEPPPQFLESLIEVGLWFIPECPQFLR